MAGLCVSHLDASSGGAGLKEGFVVAVASHIGHVFRDLCFSSLPLPFLSFRLGHAECRECFQPFLPVTL